MIWIASGVTFGVIRWIFEVQIILDRSFCDHLVPFFQFQVHISWAFKDNHVSFFPSVFLSFCRSAVLFLSLVLSFSDVSRFGHLQVFLSVVATSSHVAPFLLCSFSLHLCIFDVLVSFFSVSCHAPLPSFVSASRHFHLHSLSSGLLAPYLPVSYSRPHSHVTLTMITTITTHQ